MRKSGVIMLLSAISVLLIAVVVVIYLMGDHKGPEITFPEGSVTINSPDNYENILLEGVTAYDRRDGDVTDTIRLSEVKNSDREGEAVVVYTAKDSSNNITQVSRVIRLGAANIIDINGEISAEEEQIEPGDGAAENESRIAELDAAAPRLYLTDYNVTLPASAAAAFDPSGYILDVTDDHDPKFWLRNQIQWEGEVDLSVPGNYHVVYYVYDTENNRSNDAVLYVTVE